MPNVAQLRIAYRKAKVDLYYSSHPTLIAIEAYERDLDTHLAELAEVLQQRRPWTELDGIAGDWLAVPKTAKTSSEEGVVIADPKQAWESGANSNPVAEFRVMSECSMHFHILSTLWVIEVGQLLDKQLTSHAYGNRLRRNRDGEFNPLSLGCFKPYLGPFKHWRDDGLKAINDALGSGREVAVLTTDMQGFYHSIDARFLLHRDFLKRVDIDLDDFQMYLHRNFVAVLREWAVKTPLKIGLPVGLPAAHVVANLALISLDDVVTSSIAPIHYGRYVDDIMLVMEDTRKFTTREELWKYLADRSGRVLQLRSSRGQQTLIYAPSFLGESKVCISKSKSRLYLLKGRAGLQLLSGIADQIKEQASEWRAIAELSDTPDEIGASILAASKGDGDPSVTLGGVDKISLKKASFAILLRDFEAYERDLPAEVWSTQREAFLTAYVKLVLSSPTRFFELETYFGRVVKLAASCSEFAIIGAISHAINDLVRSVKSKCEVRLKCLESPMTAGLRKSILSRWELKQKRTLAESLLCAFPQRVGHGALTNWRDEVGFDIFRPLLGTRSPGSITEIQRFNIRLFEADLAHNPFRFIALPREMIGSTGLPDRTQLSEDFSASIVPTSISRGIRVLARWTRFREKLPRAFVYATRPFNLAELNILTRKTLDPELSDELQAVVSATRGYTLKGSLPEYYNEVLTVPWSSARNSVGVAITSWKTEFSSWIAAVSKKSDPDRGRYARLMSLINRSISGSSRMPHYLILPELSVPTRWFFRIARRLEAKGISLIAGVEYLHAPRKRVRHQVWCALVHDGFGFPSLAVYRQDKQRAAYHEELELQRVSGVRVEPVKKWEIPPLVVHGGFRFSVLICSELTNIAYRASLRGRVDAIFVPEWNPDTETFNALVESTALDTHAYVVQCNDRAYGDSRIRAPGRRPWSRDLLRVKGGADDYSVSGLLDVETLRRFQSGHRSPSKPFKPVPDGFLQDPARELLPLPDNKSGDE